MKKIFVILFTGIVGLGLSTNVMAKTHHTFPTITPTPTITVTPTPHTHQCVDPNGSYTADSSVSCMHQCVLADGTTYFAAEGVVCPTSPTTTPIPSPDLGKMPTPHTHICTLSDGTSYEADNSVACPNL